jgi:hypothetical protein
MSAARNVGNPVQMMIRHGIKNGARGFIYCVERWARPNE